MNWKLVLFYISMLIFVISFWAVAIRFMYLLYEMMMAVGG